MSSLVSVVIPVYNSETYLRECLDSVIGQTLREIEIICVDDGSTDRSHQILCEYAKSDNRIVVIEQINHGTGAGRARNRGMKQAKSKYLMFLDSDDYFDLSLIEKMVHKAEQTNADITMCDTYTYYSPTKEIMESPHELYSEYIPNAETFNREDIPDTFFQISNAAPWHKLYNRSFINTHGLVYQEEVPVIDDVYFVLMAQVLAKRIAALNERLVYYRMLNANSQTSRITEYPDSAYLALRAVQCRLKKMGIFNDIRQSFDNFAIKMLKWYLNSIKKWDSYQYLFEKYKTTYLSELGLTDHLPAYYYLSGNSFSWYQDVISKEAAQVIFDYYCGFRNGLDLVNHAFPTHLLKSASRIVLYGAGNVGRRYYAQIQNLDYKLVLWVDKNYATLGGAIVAPEKMREVEFDAVIIAIESPRLVAEVRNWLMGYGVPQAKIIHV